MVTDEPNLNERLEELIASIRALSEETKLLVRESQELIRRRQKILDRYQARSATLSLHHSN